MRVRPAIAATVLILAAVAVVVTGLFVLVVVAVPGLAIIAVSMAVTWSFRRHIHLWRWIPAILMWLVAIPVISHQIAGLPSGSRSVAVGQHVPASRVYFAGGGEAQPGPYLGDLDFDRQWWMPIDSIGSGPLIARASDYVVLARPSRAELHLSGAVIGYGPRAWWDPEQPRVFAFGGVALMAGFAIGYFLTAPAVAAVGVALEFWPRRRFPVPIPGGPDDSAASHRR